MRKLLASTLAFWLAATAALAQNVPIVIPGTTTTPPNTPAGAQALISGTPWVNHLGLVQGPNWRDNYQILDNILAGMGTWDAKGVYTPNYPAGSVPGSALAPGVVPPALGYTPLNKAGDTMTGPLVAPVQATGATVPRLNSDRAADAFSVLDFNAKCDGKTNDTLAIQAAWNAAASVSAEIALAPRGKSCVVDGLVPPSNSRARADGQLQSSGVGKSLLRFASGAANIVIEGDGVLDNGFPSTVATPNPNAPIACIDSLGPVTSLSVRGLTLQNCGNWPVNIVAYATPGGNVSRHVYFSYVKAIGGGNRNSFEFAGGCDDCWADHILIDGLTTDIGFAFYGLVTNSGLTNSRINNTALGVAVLSDGGGLGQGSQSYPSSNILIQGNEITNNLDEAIFVHGVSSTDPNAFHHAIRIIGNDGHGNNRGLSTQPAQANKGGETINECDGCTSIGNFWHDDKSDVATAAPVAGILVNSMAKNFTSIGDTVYNEGGPGGVGIGGIVATGSTSPAFHNFRAYDNQAAPSMVQAISGSCNADCMIDGTKTSGFASPWAGLGGNIGAARLFNNEGLGNYIQGDVVIPGYTTMASPRVLNQYTPATSAAACIANTIAIDVSYIYVCTASNTWKRSALTAF